MFFKDTDLIWRNITFIFLMFKIHSSVKRIWSINTFINTTEFSGLNCQRKKVNVCLQSLISVNCGISIIWETAVKLEIQSSQEFSSRLHTAAWRYIMLIYDTVNRKKSLIILIQTLVIISLFSHELHNALSNST